MAACTCARCTRTIPSRVPATPPTHIIKLGLGTELDAWIDPENDRRFITKGGVSWSRDARWAPGVLREAS